MKIEGMILRFKTNFVSHNCEIDIPEKVPLFFEFDRTNPVGYAEVVRTDEGLMCVGEIVER